MSSGNWPTLDGTSCQDENPGSGAA